MEIDSQFERRASLALRSDEVLKPLSTREKQCPEGLLQGKAPGQMAASFGLSASAVAPPAPLGVQNPETLIATG
jgi:hypothetical protein